MTDRPFALPARRTRLIGRDAELTTVRDQILHGEPRLLTLVGAGGVGKTTLGVEVARLVDGVMTDGAALIDLSIVHEADTIALACCDAFGMLDQGRAAVDVLIEYFAPRQTLIVLDNCEHLRPALGQLVDRLLDACPDLRVLATSRSPLHVSGESVFALRPLPVPDPGIGADPTQLRQAPAVELFVQRATAANPRFSLADWAPAVVAICRTLDGLPLAIELAAAQTFALTPPEIADRLAIGGVDGSSREHTMDETLDWSHDLLDDRERVLFRRLAVFSGGWTLESAEAVGSLGGDPSTIAATIVSLVEQSLVVRDGPEAGSRFRMLAPIADYASRRLAASGELDATSVAHAQHYLGVIGGESADWRTIEPEHLDVIAAEYDNCIAAMRFAEQAQIVPIVIGFNYSLLLFWRIRGLLRSGSRRLETALALVGSEPTRERGFVLAGLGHYGQLLGDLELAEAWACEAEAIFDAVGEVVGQRTVIGFLGDIALARDDFEGARAHYARARELVETDKDALDLGFWHANVGRTFARAGDPEAAERELEQALTYLRSTSDWYQGHVLVQLGSLARQRGDVPRARALLVEALGYLHRYGANLETISCLDELGRLALDHRDHRRAATLFAAATGLRDATGLTIGDETRASLVGDIDTTRSCLAPDVFTAAWGRGIGFTLDVAAAFASAPNAEMVSGRQRRRGSALTAREREIAQLVARGMTNRQIAEQLVIATGTARIHVERILGKLGLTSRVQIATWVTRAAEVP